MECGKIRSKLRAYADGRLSPAGRDKVCAHLQRCSDCRAGLVSTDWVAALMFDSEPPPVPDGLAKRVVAGAQRPHGRASAVDGNPLAWWLAATTAARVAVAVLLVACIGIGAGLGWNLAPVTTATDAVEKMGLLDAYPIDCLGGAPTGSLADRYLTLLDTAHQEGTR